MSTYRIGSLASDRTLSVVVDYWVKPESESAIQFIQHHSLLCYVNVKCFLSHKAYRAGGPDLSFS